MADYEELAELGFEGVDRVVDKYHDTVYDHLPAVPRRKKKQAQRRSSNPDKNPDKGYSRPRSGPDNPRDDEEDIEMYAPDRRQDRDYRESRDDRYYEDERSYYQGAGASAVTPRDNDGAPYQEVTQRGFDQPKESSSRGRPSAQRRGSSWSPPRSKKHHGDSHKPRSQSRSKDKQHRMLAMAGGALVGGFAGNRAGKGKKFDTVATIVGAIVGGVGAREASELWDDKRRKRDKKEENWEEEFRPDSRGGDSRDGRGSGRRVDSRQDDRRDDRRRDDSYDRSDRRRYS